MTNGNETTTPKQENENLQIRMKIMDMIDYSFPLIQKWSVAHQKLLGNTMADTMKEMAELAVELEWSHSKKTPWKKLDLKNKTLQDYITVAYRMKYLKGVSSRDEWTRRSKEIGAMLGGYKPYIYEDAPKPPEKPKRTNNGIHGRRCR